MGQEQIPWLIRRELNSWSAESRILSLTGLCGLNKRKETGNLTKALSLELLYMEVSRESHLLGRRDYGGCMMRCLVNNGLCGRGEISALPGR